MGARLEGGVNLERLGDAPIGHGETPATKAERQTHRCLGTCQGHPWVFLRHLLFSPIFSQHHLQVMKLIVADGDGLRPSHVYSLSSLQVELRTKLLGPPIYHRAGFGGKTGQGRPLRFFGQRQDLRIPSQHLWPISIQSHLLCQSP